MNFLYLKICWSTNENMFRNKFFSKIIDQSNFMASRKANFMAIRSVKFFVFF